jgi:hypothetical protein
LPAAGIATAAAALLPGAVEEEQAASTSGIIAIGSIRAVCAFITSSSFDSPRPAGILPAVL